MKKFYACLVGVSLVVSALATPSSFNDLGESQKVVDDYWNTSNRAEVTVDVASSSAEALSSSILQAWAFSPIIDIWSTPFSRFLILIR